MQKNYPLANISSCLIEKALSKAKTLLKRERKSTNKALSEAKTLLGERKKSKIKYKELCESVNEGYKRNAALVVSRWENRIFSYLIPHVIRPKIFYSIVLVDELR